MTGGRSGARILIYSHDTFGLGHLRRCRAIANAIAAAHEDSSILILSGSPIIGNFDFHDRVDFVRVPGVIKLHNGEYTSLKLPMAIEDTVELRASIIRHTAEAFDPDVFIVDKEPWGLRGEVTETLRFLKPRGTRLVLGLRDVLDEPKLLVPEWTRKNALPALRDYYDEIWIYGLREIYNPLSGFELGPEIERKIVYTGYLPREVEKSALARLPIVEGQPFILVTTGGGGDGDGLINWVLLAYETDLTLPHPALIVFGPFMPPEIQAAFMARVAKLPKIEAITFDARLESIADRAIGVVAKGGYNTFCEILSLNKRALIVPRQKPRLEQTIRAGRAENMGLVRMLIDHGEHDPAVMAAALHALPDQPLPAETMPDGLLGGLDAVNRLIAPWLRRRRRRTVMHPMPVRAAGG